MPNHDVIKFEQFKYKNFYLDELWFLSYGIINKTESLNKIVSPPQKGMAIYNNYEITDFILGILSNAANIKKLITPAERTKSESAWKYTFRCDRARFVRDFLADIDISEIMNPRARNSLEHFDEYLDKLCIDMLNGIVSTERQNISFNMAVSELDVHQPHAYPVRLYDAKEKKYYNMSAVVNLGKINSEAKNIHEKILGIKRMVGNERIERPTGWLLTYEP